MSIFKRQAFIKPGSKLDLLFAKHLNSSLFSHREILSMFGPLILDQLFINLIGVLTVSMISSSGQDSVTAVSLINPLTGLVMALMSAISSGGTVIVAQYKGRGDNAKIRTAAGHTLFISVAISITACLLLILFAQPLVHLMFGAAEQSVLTKAQNYLIGNSVSLMLHSSYVGVFAVFRGIGNTKICLRLTVVINAVHLILSMLFINVMKLDIMGTVFSLILARLIGGSVALYALFIRKEHGIYMRFKDVFGLKAFILKSILKVGIPFGVEQVFFNGGAILVQTYMVVLGTASVAANAVSNSVFALFYAMPSAVATLAITIVGQCIGAGDKDLARWYGKKMILLGTVMSVISLIIFTPLLPVILSWYSPPAETLSIIYRLLVIALIAFPFFWVTSNTMPAILRSAGDSNYSSIVSLITMWLIRVGGGYVVAIPLGFGIEGVWACMCLEWIVRVAAFGIRFHGNKWLSKKII